MDKSIDVDELLTEIKRRLPFEQQIQKNDPMYTGIVLNKTALDSYVHLMRKNLDETLHLTSASEQQVQNTEIIAERLILLAGDSAGNTVEIGYASLTDYLTKSENINKQSDDPVRFIYPLYLVRGTAFVTFNPNVPDLNSQTVTDLLFIKKFLSFRIGAGKASNSQMLLFMLAQKAPKTLRQCDIRYGAFVMAILVSLDISMEGLAK